MSWRSASLNSLAERRENSGSSATVTGTVVAEVMGDWVNLIKLKCNPLEQFCRQSVARQSALLVN